MRNGLAYDMLLSGQKGKTMKRHLKDKLVAVEQENGRFEVGYAKLSDPTNTIHTTVARNMLRESINPKKVQIVTR